MNLMQINDLTMSSREIAELTGKRHDHVLRDIRAMLDELDIHSTQIWGQYKDPTGRMLPEYHLDQELTLTLVSGYSTKLRHAIVKRWKQLEQAHLENRLGLINNEYDATLEAMRYLDKVIQLQPMVPRQRYRFVEMVLKEHGYSMARAPSELIDHALEDDVVDMDRLGLRQELGELIDVGVPVRESELCQTLAEEFTKDQVREELGRMVKDREAKRIYSTSMDPNDIAKHAMYVPYGWDYRTDLRLQ